MIPNGHATFELGEGILVAALRLCLSRRVLGLFGGRRTSSGLVQRRGCTARCRVAMVLVMVTVVVVVRVQLAIPLLPLDLVVLQRSIVVASYSRTRGNGDSCRRLTATGGMMVALMVVRRLARAASLHRVGATGTVLVLLVVAMLVLLLVGIEAQAVFIVGMRCHLAGGTLRDSDTHTDTQLDNFRCKLFDFFRFLARFGVYVCFRGGGGGGGCDGTL